MADEVVTEGLDGLRGRFEEYAALGASGDDHPHDVATTLVESVPRPAPTPG